jgi:hypothetical protein
VSRYVLPQAHAPLDLARAATRLRVLFEEDRIARAGQKLLACAGCGSVEGVALEDSRTQYVRRCLAQDCGACDGLENPCRNGAADKRQCANWPEEDPNADVPLCRKCAAEHHANWDDQWADYYAGLL